MSETMEKKLAEYREIARYGIAVGIGGGLLTEVLDHIDALAAQLATAQEQEKRWQQVCKEMCDDCDTECPPECDDYGHAPNCGQHSVPQALKNCRKELATANERVAELEASNTSKHTVMLASARALAAAERDAARYRWLFTSDTQSGVMSRCNQVYRMWDGCSDWSDAVDAAMAPRSGVEGEQP